MNNFVTVYELLGLIKDGKAPRKIEYKGDTYIYAGDDYSINDNREDWLITKYDYFLTDFLTEEVEILEEDKPIIEKIEIEEDIVCNKFVRNEYGAKCYIKTHDKIVIEKLNEVIEFLNRKENK